LTSKRIGQQTIKFENPPIITGSACVGGAWEASGPLAAAFDYLSDDAYFGADSWERAETEMQMKAFQFASEKAEIKPETLDFIFGGDLLNQCTASALAMKVSNVPYLGLYGACSTMAEGLALAAMSIDGGFAERVCAITSSHFCSAERQFRTPLEYGGTRPPTAQWTATASGAAILAADGFGGEPGFKPRVTHATIGKIFDSGVKDATNMGAAMAVAAYETLFAHFQDLNINPDHYDLIVTGDLSAIGKSIVLDFFKRGGTELTNYNDCGLMLYDRDNQDVHAGGSGCGCSASVLCGHILREMRRGNLKRVLFAGTGALMSSISSGQGESIPGICHAVAISC
jgi:stage V sporulation protein AD